MGIIQRMKCCWDYRSNINCNMRRRACVEMHSCWSFVYARDASLRPKAVYNQFSLMLSRDSVMLQDSTESFCVRRVCELSWHWASLHGTPLPQFHLILQSLFVWVLVGSGSLHSYHFGKQYTVCLLSRVEYPTMYTSSTVTFNAVQKNCILLADHFINATDSIISLDVYITYCNIQCCSTNCILLADHFINATDSITSLVPRWGWDEPNSNFLGSSITPMLHDVTSFTYSGYWFLNNSAFIVCLLVNWYVNIIIKVYKTTKRCCWPFFWVTTELWNQDIDYCCI